MVVFGWRSSTARCLSLAMGWAVGCGGSEFSPTNAGGAAGIGGWTTTATSTATGGAGGAGGATGTGGALVDGSDDVSARDAPSETRADANFTIDDASAGCNDVVNVAPVIAGQVVAASLPTPMGRTMVDR